MATALSEADVETLLDIFELAGYLDVGCINSPINTTVTGDADMVEEFRKSLDTEGIYAKIVPTGIAYHSAHMYSVANEYRRVLQDIKPKLENHDAIQFFSPVFGEAISTEALGKADYWVTNLLSKI